MKAQAFRRLRRRLVVWSRWLDRHIAWVFVAIALPVGTLLIFRLTPLFGNDEIVHFPRAFQVQEGQLKPEHLQGYDYGGNEPTQLKQFVDDYRVQVQDDRANASQTQTKAIKAIYDHERLTSSDRQPLAFSSSAVSAGWDYTAPAVGIRVARLLNLPLNWYVYLARFACLVLYVFLTFLAIRYIPIGKRFLLVVALLPTALTQGFTIGLDGMVNGLCWLMIALTFAVLVKKLAITPKLLAFLLFLGGLQATTKQGYVALAALPLLFPARLFPFNLKKVWLWRLAFGGVLLIVSLWYLGATSQVASIIHYVQRPGLNIDEGQQLHYIFQHPLLFLSIIFVQPFTVWAASVYGGMVGIITNKLVTLPVLVIALLYASLGLTVFHKEREHVYGRDRLYVLVSSVGAFLATFILINVALYLSFTQVGIGHVEGLQGRYFLALFPLIGIILHTALPRLFVKVPDVLVNALAYPAIATGLIATFLAIH